MKSRPERLAAAALGVLLAACRRGMEEQPKVRELAPSAFFADGRGARPRVPGTVPAGPLESEELAEGRDGGRAAAAFPFKIDAAALARGRERYDVYCAPCHGRTGAGDGMAVRRGFPRPPSLHEPRLRAAPAGLLVGAIARGSGRMYPFADRIAPRERWEIAAYVRALQLSRDADLSDAPPSRRAELEALP